MKTYILKWVGPYNDINIKNCEEKKGLYLITGFQKFKKTKCIQYCGITENYFSDRLANNHHKKDLITRKRQFWLGKIINFRTTSREHLELVEKLIIYCWQPELNEKKKCYPPEPIAIINRWYDVNGLLRKRFIHEAQQLHDVIYWDGENWHISDRLKVFLD